MPVVSNTTPLNYLVKDALLQPFLDRDALRAQWRNAGADSGPEH